MFYECDLGIISAWNDALRIGTPICSDVVTQYMVLTLEERKKADVVVKQAQALLDSYLKETIAPMCTRMYCTSNTTERVILAQELALFSVAFRTTRRGDEFSRPLI